MLTEVPKFKMITVSILADRMRINCSLARRALVVLEEKGLIKPLVTHSKQKIFTRAVQKAE